MDYFLNVSNVDEAGGEVTVNQFIERAEKECATASNSANPFICMDLIYISVLLKDAYGLDNKTKIKVSLHLFIYIYVLFFSFIDTFAVVSNSQRSWGDMGLGMCL